jgi:hypothetical protein
MGKIYFLAKEVLVWLGPSSVDAEDFIWLHNDFLPQLRECLGNDFLNRTETRRVTATQLREMGLDDPTLRAGSYAKCGLAGAGYFKK